jgi:Cu(I)/Ag(I) efflux system membrane fusion protein
MTRSRRFVAIAAVAVALLAALGLGYWWGRSPDQVSATGGASTTSGEGKVLYWYDPMVPDQHFDKPGKSPFMDMQLVPKYADEATAGGVAIAPACARTWAFARSK